jgi:hypothetical protein
MGQEFHLRRLSDLTSAFEAGAFVLGQPSNEKSVLMKQ